VKGLTLPCKASKQQRCPVSSLQHRVHPNIGGYQLCKDLGEESYNQTMIKSFLMT